MPNDWAPNDRLADFFLAEDDSGPGTCLLFSVAYNTVVMRQFLHAFSMQKTACRAKEFTLNRQTAVDDHELGWMTQSQLS